MSHGFYGPRPRISRFSRWLNAGMLKSRSSLNELERNSGTVIWKYPAQRGLSGSNMDCASRVRPFSCCACTRDAWNRDALSLSLSLRSPNAASPRNVLRLTRANTGEKEESLVGSRKEDFCRSRIFLSAERWMLLPWRCLLRWNYCSRYGKIFRYDDPVKDWNISGYFYFLLGRIRVIGEIHFFFFLKNRIESIAFRGIPPVRFSRILRNSSLRSAYIPPFFFSLSLSLPSTKFHPFYFEELVFERKSRKLCVKLPYSISIFLF